MSTVVADPVRRMMRAVRSRRATLSWDAEIWPIEVWTEIVFAVNGLNIQLPAHVCSPATLEKWCRTHAGACGRMRRHLATRGLLLSEPREVVP